MLLLIVSIIDFAYNFNFLLVTKYQRSETDSTEELVYSVLIIGLALIFYSGSFGFIYMAYSVWNDRLLRYFFGSFASNEQIRLTLTKDLLDSEFGDLGGYESFKFAVLSGPEWPIFRGDWEYSFFVEYK